MLVLTDCPTGNQLKCNPFEGIWQCIWLTPLTPLTPLKGDGSLQRRGTITSLEDQWTALAVCLADFMGSTWSFQPRTSVFIVSHVVLALVNMSIIIAIITSFCRFVGQSFLPFFFCLMWLFLNFLLITLRSPKQTD